MEYAWILWFFIAIVFAVIEILNVSFFMIWFGVGSLFSMVISLFTTNLIIQFLTFFIVSIILLFMTRKLTSKFSKGEVTHTNINAVIGKIGIVTKDIIQFDKPGLVKVSGEIWSAIAVDRNPILKNETIKVIKVEGVKLIVQKENSEMG